MARPAALAAGACLLALMAVQGCPAAVEALQFDRPAIAAGQVWRLLTGNLVHWSWLHLAADAAALMGLLYVARPRGWAAPAMLATAGAAVGGAVYLWAPEITLYRGCSGVNFALLAWALVTLAAGGPRRALACTALAVLAGGKIAIEIAAGTSPMPNSLPDGVAVVGVAHAAGLAAGAMMALAAGLRRRSGAAYALGLG